MVYSPKIKELVGEAGDSVAYLPSIAPGMTPAIRALLYRSCDPEGASDGADPSEVRTRLCVAFSRLTSAREGHDAHCNTHTRTYALTPRLDC